MLNINLKLFAYNKLFNELVSLDNESKLPSRILITGQEGIGKSTFSLHFINYLFSKNELNKYDTKENKINQNSSSYNLIKNLSHPNLFYVSKNDGKKNIEIEQIRNMISFLNKSSFNNNKKVILIDGAEYLNASSSNALLKSLEESGDQNLFILTHNVNRSILDTIKSRCLIYKMKFNYSENQNIISEYHTSNMYDELNSDFKSILLSPKFLLNHISYAQDNKLDLSNLGIQNMLKHIIDNKSYKKSDFINNYFQNYIEIFFTNMYLKTKEYKYYDIFLKIVSENNLINNFNLDLDSFFAKFENKYLNI